MPGERGEELAKAFVNIGIERQQMVQELSSLKGLVTANLIGLANAGSAAVGGALSGTMAAFSAGIASNMGGAFAAFAMFEQTLKGFMDGGIAAENQWMKFGLTIKNMGPWIGYSRDQLEFMNTEMQATSSFGSFAIRNAQIGMMKFHNVSGDNFRAAMNAAADVAAFTGQEIEHAVHLIGHSLEMPEHGVRRLRRMGIMASEAQMQTIKGMTARGDIEGAQKEVLALITRATSGAAGLQRDTTQGQLNLAENAWSSMIRDVGEGLLPMMKAGVPGMIAMADAIKANKDLFARFGSTVGTVMTMVSSSTAGMLNSLKGISPEVKNFTADFLSVFGITKALQVGVAWVMPWVKTVGGAIAGIALSPVKAAFSGLVGIGSAVVSGVSAIGSGIGGVFKSVLDVGHAFKGIFVDTVASVVTVASTTTSTVFGSITAFLGSIGGLVGSVGSLIGTTFGAVMNTAGAVLGAVGGLIGSFVSSMTPIVGALVMNALADPETGPRMKSALASITNTIFGTVSEMLRAVGESFGLTFSSAKFVVVEIFESIAGWVNRNKDTFMLWARTVGSIIGGLLNLAGQMIGSLASGAVDLVRDMTGSWEEGGESIGGVLESIRVGMVTAYAAIAYTWANWPVVWGAIWTGAQDLFFQTWEAIAAFMADVWETIKGYFTGFTDWLASNWVPVVAGVMTAFAALAVTNPFVAALAGAALLITLANEAANAITRAIVRQADETANRQERADFDRRYGLAGQEGRAAIRDRARLLAQQNSQEALTDEQLARLDRPLDELSEQDIALLSRAAALQEINVLTSQQSRDRTAALRADRAAARTELARIGDELDEAFPEEEFPAVPAGSVAAGIARARDEMLANIAAAAGGPRTGVGGRSSTDMTPHATQREGLPVKFGLVGFEDMWKKIQEGITGVSMMSLARQTMQNTREVADNGREQVNQLRQLRGDVQRIQPGLG